MLPLGLVAVFGYAFVIFVPYDMYKRRKKIKSILQQLGNAIDKGTVDTIAVNAINIAIAKEYDDEGHLFLIEYDTDSMLYLWDRSDGLHKKFPCLNFEIYEDSFFLLTGRQIYPLSDKTNAVIIDKKAKWSYINKTSWPENLQTEHVSFETLIQRFNDCA